MNNNLYNYRIECGQIYNCAYCLQKNIVGTHEYLDHLQTCNEYKKLVNCRNKMCVYRSKVKIKNGEAAYCCIQCAIADQIPTEVKLKELTKANLRGIFQII